MSLRLSVALCTYNPRADILDRVLEAIAKQIEAVPGSEAIVVDNNSSPSLAELGSVDGYPVRLIHEHRQGLTFAREAAIRAARGDIVLFVDDDNIVGDDYLATVIEIFARDPRLGVLGASVVPEYEVPPPAWLREFEPQLAIRRYAPDQYVETDVPFSLHFPIGAGFAARRELALAHLLDCEKTGRIEGRRGTVLSAGEDLDLGLFVLLSGYKLAVSGALRVTHVIPERRVSREYMQRLVLGNLKSAMALENKWAGRLGRSIFPWLSAPMPALIGKTAVALALGLWSQRWRIKSVILVARTRARLGLEV